MIVAEDHGKAAGLPEDQSSAPSRPPVRYAFPRDEKPGIGGWVRIVCVCGSMIGIAIASGTYLALLGMPVPFAALQGAGFGVTVVFFAIFFPYRLWMWWTRGVPFRAGDRVEITTGEFAGRRGRVTHVVDLYKWTTVDLDEDSSGLPVTFRSSQLRKEGWRRRRPELWAARISGVREVSLFGSADLGFWRERLRGEDLVPLERDGRAQIMIVAAEMRFLLVTFRELSVSVRVVSPDPEIAHEAAFLAGAFNSVRYFAFSERRFFSTPYEHAAVRVSSGLPCGIEIVSRGESVFSARMREASGDDDRPLLREGNDGWEGAIFLPSASGSERPRRFFFARLRGPTSAYPFVPGKDLIAIRPPHDDGGALSALRDSNFTAEEWIVRTDATHAKSRTYRRDAFFGLAPGERR